VSHYSFTYEGVVSSVVELTAVLANLVPVLASRRVLCPNRSGFEGRGVVVDRPVFVCGQDRGGPLTEARTRYSVGYGGVPPPCAPIVSELLQQCAAWRCRGRDGRTGLTATGMTAPAGLTSWLDPVLSRKEHSRVPSAPFEGSAC
jgi:hypothetical protein